MIHFRKDYFVILLLWKCIWRLMLWYDNRSVNFIYISNQVTLFIFYFFNLSPSLYYNGTIMVDQNSAELVARGESPCIS